jgi:hypothetical protein
LAEKDCELIVLAVGALTIAVALLVIVEVVALISATATYTTRLLELHEMIYLVEPWEPGMGTAKSPHPITVFNDR